MERQVSAEVGPLTTAALLAAVGAAALAQARPAALRPALALPTIHFTRPAGRWVFNTHTDAGNDLSARQGFVHFWVCIDNCVFASYSIWPRPVRLRSLFCRRTPSSEGRSVRPRSGTGGGRLGHNRKVVTCSMFLSVQHPERRSRVYVLPSGEKAR